MITEEFKMQHNKSIVVPIDNASDNLHFVCLMQRVQVLINELDLDSARLIINRGC